MTSKRNIFIRFKHGLGDKIQFTIILKHIARYRPDWNVAILTNEPYQDLFNDYAPTLLESEYEETKRVLWSPGEKMLDPHVPPTKVSRCLIREFGIQPDFSLYSYKIPTFSSEQVLEWLPSQKYVLIHPTGITSQHRKNMTEEEVSLVSSRLKDQGFLPIILDFTLLNMPFSIPNLYTLIDKSSGMVGIDSGPEHFALALNKPVQIIWKGWFPMHNIEPHPLLSNWICQESLRHWKGEQQIPSWLWHIYNVSFYRKSREICLREF